ncbi:MAG: hypothetical protein RLZZ444_4567 [Pseudomonadota bacterium]|jgi:hypothetical protein
MKRKSSRYEVQPWPSVSSFELLFEPLYAVGPEESGKRISAYELMLRREYRLALEGNLASQKVIMRVLRSNERARAVRDRRGSRIAYEEYRYPPCDYEAVLCLLGIAVRLNGPERYEIDSLGQYVPDLIRRADDPTLRLNPWAFDLAAQRLKLVDEEKRDWLEKRVMPAGEECDSPVIIEPDPPRRDPKDTRFQKGRSGNPKGRPRKAEKLDPLPFETFLDEKVPARINGELRQITRLEALLFQMCQTARKRDPV